MHAAVFNVFRALERFAARSQGKGYGAATIAREVALATRFLKTAPELAVDIGANLGDYTAELRQRFPNLRIYAFEPSATNCAHLRERFRKDANVTVVPLAAAESTGTATLFTDSPGSALASLSKRRLQHLDIDLSAEETIQTTRFEDYWKSQLHECPVDLVKMDVEGHELAVLRGFGAALENVRVCQFEFGGANIDTRTFLQDFWYLFHEHGFAIYRISPLGAQAITRYRQCDETFSTTNFFAVNQRFERSCR